MNRYFLYLILTIIIIILSWGVFFYNNYGDKLPIDVKIDSIIVEKSKHRMHVYSDSKLIKSYRISLGKNPVGDKQFEGDKKTPEGLYFINDKNPKSTCYKNLGISYPNNVDRKLSASLGKNTGGSIKIHGLLNGKGWIGRYHLFSNWTAGCIAVTNREMDELYDAVVIGASIEIQP